MLGVAQPALEVAEYQCVVAGQLQRQGAAVAPPDTAMRDGESEPPRRSRIW